MSEKNEKPTEKKIKESRKKGQVIKSKEITSGIQLASIFVYFYFYGFNLISLLSKIIVNSINESQNLSNTSLTKISTESFFVLFNIIGKLSILLIFVTILTELIQVGPLLAFKSLGFKLVRINPIENIKQMLSFKNIIQVIKSIVKILILSSSFIYIIKKYSNAFQYLPNNPTEIAISLTSTFISWLLQTLIVSYIFFGFSDYLIQRKSVLKQMMMSKDEIKKEHKESEGSPEIKRKRKELQNEISSGSFESNIKKSTVIVRNPAHIAVCLFYHPEEAPIPKVLEKGIDLYAGKIVSIATAFNVPQVENITLARDLYFNVNNGDNIPTSLFEPVAALLRCILDINYEKEQL
ncbi:MAG: EscU/YscU/HrcU family type III secretion system export apparatus switch protein [Plesiomonas sp.]